MSAWKSELPRSAKSTTRPQSRSPKVTRSAPDGHATARSTAAATVQRKAAKASGGKNVWVALIAG
jgi:hypothetical protein